MDIWKSYSTSLLVATLQKWRSNMGVVVSLVTDILILVENKVY